MDNICYLCNTNPGVECPGRKENERTKCKECLANFLAIENIDEAIYQLKIMREEIISDQKIGLKLAKIFAAVFEKLDEHKWKFYTNLLKVNNEK